MPAPIPARLPFSASSALASSTSARTSDVVWSASCLTSSVVGLSDRSLCVLVAPMPIGYPHAGPTNDRSVEETRHVGERGPLGRLLLLALRAEIDERDEALVVVEAQRGPPFGRLEDPGRAPVGGETARVRAEQDRVRGARGRVQVLLVLRRIAGEDRGDGHERRRALELACGLGAGGLLESVERERSEHAEAP